MPVATPARPSAAPHRTEETDYGPGDLIASKYRLQHHIGEGGMGTVWLARNMTLHADVALKLVRRQIAGSDEAAQRLLTEARAAAQLEHPAIVKVHDFGETDRGDPFIVMELLKGESLDDMLEELGALPPPFVGQVLLPILSALMVVHEKGIVHRDIKPDNIILVPDGAGDYLPKLVDFGIARLRYRTVDTDEELPEETAHRVTQMGRILGSPEFMSPEQARGDPTIDGRTDLWSLTVVLYHAITGDFPFEGDDVEKQLLSILADAPKPIADHGIDDEELWNVIAKGLQKPAKMRWRNANAMGRALASWLMGIGVDADITGRSLLKQWTDMRGSRPPLNSGYPSVPPPAFSSQPPGRSSIPPAQSSNPSNPSIPGTTIPHPSIPPPGRLPGSTTSDAPGPVVGEAVPSRGKMSRAVIAGAAILATAASGALLLSVDEAPEETMPAVPQSATPLPEPSALAVPEEPKEVDDATATTTEETEDEEDADAGDEEPPVRQVQPRRPVQPRPVNKPSAPASATATTQPPPPPPPPPDGDMPLPDDALF